MPSIPPSQRRLPLKSIHRLAGTIRAVFVGLHLLNQLTRLSGAETYQAFMETLGPCYRHWSSETVLLLAVAVELLSGFGQLGGFQMLPSFTNRFSGQAIPTEYQLFHLPNSFKTFSLSL